MSFPRYSDGSVASINDQVKGKSYKSIGTVKGKVIAFLKDCRHRGGCDCELICVVEVMNRMKSHDESSRFWCRGEDLTLVHAAPVVPLIHG